MISRRHVIAGAVVSPVLLQASLARAAEGPHSIEDFLKTPRDRDAALSPDGDKIAVASTRKLGDKDDAYVTLIAASAPDKTLVVLPLGDRKVENVAWANETRLLITLVIKTKPARAPTGTRLQDHNDDKPIYARRILAIDVDGKNSVILFDDGTGKLRAVFDLGSVVDLLLDDPRHILMKAWNADVGIYCLYKVDVYSGDVEMLERGTLKTRTWLTQAGVPVVRYDANDRGTVQSIFVRPPGATDWTFYRKLRSDELNKQDFRFLSATAESGVMFVATREGVGGTIALRKFDLATLKVGDVLASRPDRDVEAALHTRKGEFLAASFVEDRLTYQFADPKMAAHFRGLNKYLGDTCNIDVFDMSDDGNRFLAWVSGPRDPGSIFFYDKAAKRFDGIGERMPDLVPDRLGAMETLTVKTRDGATITAYLTTPLATGPRPLVVMPHGGPELRDTYDFDTFAQVMAAQGWMVLQPNFRGSGGYGKAFADAGRKRWGDRMQEDVEDAVAQLVATGRVDAGKIAICGGSYGGYAALMGAVRRPDLYKAVVALAGDADLVESIAFTKTQDGPDSPSYFYWLETIGDPAKDRAMLEAASPALHADRIQAPVLLIHGAEDVIVGVKQSRIMAKALRDAGKSVELIEMKGIGHRDLKEDEWRLVYTRSVDHIAKAFKA